MKESVKKFFLIGLGIAAAAGAAGLAYANRKKIKAAVDELVKKGKIKAEEGEKLIQELLEKAENGEKPKAAKKKVTVKARKK